MRIIFEINWKIFNKTQQVITNLDLVHGGSIPDVNR